MWYGDPWTAMLICMAHDDEVNLFCQATHEKYCMMLYFFNLLLHLFIFHRQYNLRLLHWTWAEPSDWPTGLEVLLWDETWADWLGGSWLADGGQSLPRDRNNLTEPGSGDIVSDFVCGRRPLVWGELCLYCTVQCVLSFIKCCLCGIVELKWYDKITHVSLCI